MKSWKEFAELAPDLAAFGKARFLAGVGYLATVRADGGPRVHPVTPIIADDLYLFMESTSPKGKDLQRDGRFSLHCAVENSSGGEGEFYVRGHASLITDPKIRELAIQAATYSPKDRYILFVLKLEFAFKNVYLDSGSETERWQA